MTKNRVKPPKKGSFIVFSYDYFIHIHYDNRWGIITDSDYLAFSKKNLECFFENNLTKNDSKLIDILNDFGRLNEKQVEYMFDCIEYVIKNDDFYSWYGEIKEYILLEGVPEKKFVSSAF